MKTRLKNFDNAHGGGSALPLALAYLQHEIAPLLNGRHDHVIGRDFAGAVAELALDVGWMAYDIHRHDLARRYLIHALRFAHAGGDRLLGARILCALSHQALHVGQVSLALDLIRTARRGTGPVTPPRVVAMLAAMEGCVLAAADDPDGCAVAISEAEAALQQTRPDDEEPGWLDFDEGALLGHAARAYRDLRQTERATRHAEQSVAACKSGHGRTRAQRTAILATAAIQAGMIDRAAVLGEQIVAEAWNLRSSHVEGDVANLVTALTPTRSGSVVDFLAGARDFLGTRTPVNAL